MTKSELDSSIANQFWLLSGSWMEDCPREARWKAEVICPEQVPLEQPVPHSTALRSAGPSCWPCWKKSHSCADGAASNAKCSTPRNAPPGKLESFKQVQREHQISFSTRCVSELTLHPQALQPLRAFYCREDSSGGLPTPTVLLTFFSSP